MIDEKSIEKSGDSDKKAQYESLNVSEDIPEKSPEIYRTVKPEEITPFELETNIPTSSVVFKRASLDEKPSFAKKSKNLGFSDAAKIKRDKKSKVSKPISPNEEDQISKL